MSLWIVSFTARGSRLAAEIASHWRTPVQRFSPGKYCFDPDCRPLTDGIRPWTEDAFARTKQIVFVGAVGIAVRAIAPYVRDKRTDPAVVVLDEGGRFAVSLLSGHLGGANRLAEELAAQTGAVPVITTATDGAGLFAVDLFAKDNHLAITDMGLAKEISAALLDGKRVGFASELPVTGRRPAELSESGELGVAVTERRTWRPFPRTLTLIPRRLALGIGCRRGVSKRQIDRVVETVLEENGFHMEQLCCVSSIELKKDELGLLSFCQAQGLPFYSWSAAELNALAGEFSFSEFVKQQTGVDCVCERAAVRAAGGPLVLGRQARDGVTVALARWEEGVSFV
ncbi:MAG: cobalt-precorrin 5A hydrolase [Clostridia bacterium]|nr:cobalt-precorrin 5A hydrolase [Clostridia bacterium]